MASNPTLTRDAVWYLPQWLGTQWGSELCARHGELEFVPGNRYASVPKTAAIDRSIAVEPSINVFYQLGLGKAIRNRLKQKGDYSFGWNLDVAQEIHRQTAAVSSVTQEFATLDLSNASDTVACNLVKLLLPHRWYEALADLRSPKTRLNGHWVKLEKFSSMGNGYTFELETLIFSALALYVARLRGHPGYLGMDVFVFGDDIILPDDCTGDLTALLSFCGFTVNLEKSFFGSFPFRESCGGDYYSGYPVRPYFLKKDLDGPSRIISYLNGIQALSLRLEGVGYYISRRPWLRALDLLPTSVRKARGPVALGDIVIHDEQERWDTRTRNGIRYLRCFRASRHRLQPYARFDPGVVLACATYGAGNVGTPVNGRVPPVEGVIPRDGVLSYKVGWVPWS